MADRCLLYYITNRAAFAGDEAARRFHLLHKIAEAANHGVDYIQLREKDLPTRALETLAGEAMRIILNNSKSAAGDRWGATALLINSRTDVALSVAANGVHLPAENISPEEVRTTWKNSSRERNRLDREIAPAPLISISCHSQEEVLSAAGNQANLAIFAPVFEKQSTPGAAPQGLQALRQACRAKIPVLALGGITLQNAASCLHAGAAGIAAIRLFQENDIAAIVRKLRS